MRGSEAFWARGQLLEEDLLEVKYFDSAFSLEQSSSSEVFNGGLVGPRLVERVDRGSVAPHGNHGAFGSACAEEDASEACWLRNIGGDFE